MSSALEILLDSLLKTLEIRYCSFDKEGLLSLESNI